MSNRISLDRETVDHMILVGMDVDRYQTQVIPDLQQKVGELTRALKDLVGAVGAARQNPALASHVMARLRERRRSSKPVFLRQMEGSCEFEATR